jgi:tetratricopeptide (TPR) repeat protein
LNGFVAFYNCGVCYRVLENFEKSIENFETALKMSADENDLESYTLCLAQLAISYIFIGNIEAFIEHSNEFSEKNKSLGHIEMDLEMQILSGYIYNYTRDLDISKDFYKKSLKNSIICENDRYKAISLCNIGIIEADKDINEFLNNLGDPELSQKIDFDYNDNDELLNENQDEEEQQMKQLENMQQEEIDNGEQVNENNGEEHEEGQHIENGEYEGNEGEMGGNEGNQGEMEGNEGEYEGNQGVMEGHGETEDQGGNEEEREGEDEQYQGDADDIEGADEEN